MRITLGGLTPCRSPIRFRNAVRDDYKGDMPPPLRLVVADDHAVLRQGLVGMLSEAANVQVLGQAGNWSSLRDLIEKHHPDVAVSDLSMPGTGIVELMDWLRSTSRTTRVLTLTMHEDPVNARRTLAAGVHGYCLKSRSFEELLAAVNAVAAGRQVIDEIVAAKLSADRPDGLLTPRELDVLRLLVAGKSSKQIALDLGLSVKTIDNQRTSIMQKLDCHSATELVRYALEHPLEFRL